MCSIDDTRRLGRPRLPTCARVPWAGSLRVLERFMLSRCASLAALVFSTLLHRSISSCSTSAVLFWQPAAGSERHTLASIVSRAGLAPPPRHSRPPQRCCSATLHQAGSAFDLRLLLSRFLLQQVLNSVAPGLMQAHPCRACM